MGLVRREAHRRLGRVERAGAVATCFERNGQVERGFVGRLRTEAVAQVANRLVQPPESKRGDSAHGGELSGQRRTADTVLLVDGREAIACRSELPLTQQGARAADRDRGQVPGGNGQSWTQGERTLKRRFRRRGVAQHAVDRAFFNSNLRRLPRQRSLGDAQRLERQSKLTAPPVTNRQLQLAVEESGRQGQRPLEAGHGGLPILQLGVLETELVVGQGRLRFVLDLLEADSQVGLSLGAQEIVAAGLSVVMDDPVVVCLRQRMARVG